MRKVLAIFLIMFFVYPSMALVSLSQQMGQTVKEARVFPAQATEISPEEGARRSLCHNTTPSYDIESVCFGIPLKNFDPIRHSVCMDRSADTLSYTICMYNKVDLSLDQVQQCWEDATTEFYLYTCFFQRQDIEDVDTLAKELKKKFDTIPVIDPHPERFEEQAEEGSIWSEA